MKRFFICFLGIILPFQLLFSQFDEAKISFDRSDIEKFSYKKIILPTTLISLGVIGMQTSINQDIKLLHKNKNRLKIDDYIQYVPITGVYVLSNLGLEARNSLKDRLLIGFSAYAMTAIFVNGIKYSTKILRPDGSSRNSFPSGHTAVAFTGAEILWQEYKNENIWVGISGYSLATFTAYMRIYNQRHWASDVLAGAGIGILSAKIAYWILPYVRQIFPQNKNKTSVEFFPMYSENSKGIVVNICF